MTPERNQPGLCPHFNCEQCVVVNPRATHIADRVGEYHDAGRADEVAAFQNAVIPDGRHTH